GEVKDELENLGYTVRTQIGCKGYNIDLAVIHPKFKNLFIAGIECDGEMYHSTKSAKDRDIYRQTVLESAGWNIIRIWSRDWWTDKNREIKRIDREIKAFVSKTKEDKSKVNELKLPKIIPKVTIKKNLESKLKRDEITIICNGCTNQYKESQMKYGGCPYCGSKEGIVK
ncbi:MAG: DUF559 domain-containing protein, partial [Candidatus Woesearchaeota archaeon]